MKRITRLGVLGASVISALFLTVGMGVASADTIANTGPGSFNAILSKSSSFETVRNVNNINLNNQNRQTAITGTASVSGNTNNKDGNGIRKQCPQHKTFSVMPSHFVRPSSNNNFGGQGGSATSGDASNFNTTTASVNVTNNVPVSRHVSSNLGGNNTISTTGPHSVNLISSKTTNNVTVANTNNVAIDNTNNQTAISGNANVSGNTRGGSAVTGDATNVNSTRFDVAIMNQ